MLNIVWVTASLRARARGDALCGCVARAQVNGADARSRDQVLRLLADSASTSVVLLFARHHDPPPPPPPPPPSIQVDYRPSLCLCRVGLCVPDCMQWYVVELWYECT